MYRMTSTVKCLYLVSVYASQSSKMSDAIYNSHWTDQDKKFKLMLLTMLIRAQKEYTYTAYGIISLNLQRVTTVSILMEYLC